MASSGVSVPSLVRRRTCPVAGQMNGSGGEYMRRRLARRNEEYLLVCPVILEPASVRPLRHMPRRSTPVWVGWVAPRGTPCSRVAARHATPRTHRGAAGRVALVPPLAGDAMRNATPRQREDSCCGDGRMTARMVLRGTDDGAIGPPSHARHKATAESRGNGCQATVVPKIERPRVRSAN